MNEDFHLVHELNRYTFWSYAMRNGIRYCAHKQSWKCTWIRFRGVKVILPANVDVIRFMLNFLQSMAVELSCYICENNSSGAWHTQNCSLRAAIMSINLRQSRQWWKKYPPEHYLSPISNNTPEENQGSDNRNYKTISFVWNKRVKALCAFVEKRSICLQCQQKINPREWKSCCCVCHIEK